MRELLQDVARLLSAYREELQQRDGDERPPTQIEKAVIDALSRSKWVKFSDALPIVPEGKFSVHIWCWRDGQKGKPYTSNFWAVGFKLSESAATHWQYRQDDTPAPPEAS